MDDRLHRLTRRLADARAGSAIVEFALIAPVFFLLLFAIIEIGVIYYAQSTLQFGADDIARMVRTGQVQGANMTQTQVRNVVCNDIAPLIPCDGNLDVDVESFANFSNVTYSPPLNGQGVLNNVNNFQVGAACNVVLVRVFYAWPVFTPLLTAFLTNMANNNHLLYAAAAFRNEPFNVGVSGC